MSQLMTLWLFGLLFGLGIGVAACEYRKPPFPVLGYEAYDQYCSDGLDNDGDGLIDCDDPECPFTSPWCGEQAGAIPPPRRAENNVFLCSDQYDNDDNGQFDCGDRKCQGIQELCCTREFSDQRCADGIDNDGNGFADCADFGCRRGAYVTVCGSSETRVAKSIGQACSDGFDADANGLVDCEDPACRGTGDCPRLAEEGADTCLNGIDDDGDGPIDCDDPDCRGRFPGVCVAEDTRELCQDGLDNDDNNFPDCRDRACEAFADICPREDSVEACFDGVDNNNNGFTDCDDFSCARSSVPEVAERCDLILENTFEKCNDGIDNDGNGFADCDDFSCNRPGLPRDPSALRPQDARRLIRLLFACDEVGGSVSDTIRQALELATRENGEVTLPFPSAQELCGDAEDNDADGFVDCNDWNCNWYPPVRDICVAEGTPRICE